MHIYAAQAPAASGMIHFTKHDIKKQNKTQHNMIKQNKTQHDMLAAYPTLPGYIVKMVGRTC
jgi:hypothetical protein